VLNFLLQFLEPNRTVMLVGERHQPAYLLVEKRNQRLQARMGVAAHTTARRNRPREAGDLPLQILYEPLGHRQRRALVGQRKRGGAIGRPISRQVGAKL
jgi:hypothetical protein